jgi:hypothetical protein
MNMTSTRRIALVWLFLCCAISVLWGYSMAYAAPNGMGDFKSVYYGTQCLIQHQDPYKAGAPLQLYLAEGDGRQQPSSSLREVLSLQVYLPPAFLLIAPFAMLPLGVASLLWTILTAVSLFMAAFLMWKLAGNCAPGLSLLLICFVIANSEMLFVFGNSAGFSLSLCMVAVWCFLERRFVLAGIVCLAVSLVVKPHDAGLVWLYFLLAGGVYRRRALQTLALAVAVSLPALLWVTRVSPHWIPELRANLLTVSTHGYLADPGPTSITGRNVGMIIDLQSILSLLRDDPRFYNPATYLICGVLLLAWTLRTLRGHFSQPSAKLALAAVTAFTLLVAYHRTADAKLLLLTVPACAMLWAEGGPMRWIALLLNGAAIVLTGDISLYFLLNLTRNMSLSPTGLSRQILAGLLLRPIPFLLLLLGIFYLWLYLRRDAARTE